MIILLYIIIFCIFTLLLFKNRKENYNENYNGGYNGAYRRLNMSCGESPWKCGSCTTYGSQFDYIKQKGDQTYGVPNGCQKIF